MKNTKKEIKIIQIPTTFFLSAMFIFYMNGIILRIFLTRFSLSNLLWMFLHVQDIPQFPFQ